MVQRTFPGTPIALSIDPKFLFPNHFPCRRTLLDQRHLELSSSRHHFGAVLSRVLFLLVDDGVLIPHSLENYV